MSGWVDLAILLLAKKDQIVGVLVVSSVGCVGCLFCGSRDAATALKIAKRYSERDQYPSLIFKLSKPFVCLFGVSSVNPVLDLCNTLIFFCLPMIISACCIITTRLQAFSTK